MKRRISVLLATMLAAGTFVVLGPTQPASAWVVCAGTGRLLVSDPGFFGTANFAGKTPGSIFELSIGRGNPEYAFGLDLSVGACVHASPTETLVPTDTVSATGIVKGYCEFSTGRAVTAWGDLFAWVSVGNYLILTGHLVGVVRTVPDPVSGQSCATGAREFIATGTMVVFNCDGDLQTLVPGTPPSHETLVPVLTTQFLTPFPLVHVLVNLGLHYYWNHLCIGNLLLP